MSKRFIDTGLFDDEWFMNLTQDGKLLWVYFITKCDHAGILRLNMKLCKVQTDIKNIDTVIKELGNRLVTVSEHLFFIPKFINYQYPGFPNSKVRQQQSAVEILTNYKLIDKGIITVSKELSVSDISVKEVLANTYDSENDDILVNIKFDVFWDLYDKKVGDRTKLINKWNLFTDSERQTIIDFIPNYVKTRPYKQFRKNPETFFNNKSWNK